MAKVKGSATQRIRRKTRVRGKVVGTAARPRLSVFRSAKHIFAQLIDDQKAVTLASLSDLKVEGANKTERARAVGREIAKKAGQKKIKRVVFDRGGYAYHGRVKAVAEGAREGGLEF